MGYYTSYNLDVKGVENKERFEELQNALKQIGVIYYALDSGEYLEKIKLASFYTYDSAKWYEYNDDMKNLSLIFPKFLFCLEGVGEDWDDRWRAYYHYGESEFCPAQIIFKEPERIKWSEE